MLSLTLFAHVQSGDPSPNTPASTAEPSDLLAFSDVLAEHQPQSALGDQLRIADPKALPSAGLSLFDEGQFLPLKRQLDAVSLFGNHTQAEEAHAAQLSLLAGDLSEKQSPLAQQLQQITEAIEALLSLHPDSSEVELSNVSKDLATSVNESTSLVLADDEALEPLVTVESQAVPGITETPLANWLGDEWGLTDQQVAEVMAVLQDWVANPPQLEQSSMKLDAPVGSAESDGVITSWNQLLSEVEESLIHWHSAIEPRIGSSANTQPLFGSSADNQALLSLESRMLAATTDASKAAQPVLEVVQTLSRLLASADAGPVTNPEQPLLAVATSTTGVAFDESLLAAIRDNNQMKQVLQQLTANVASAQVDWSGAERMEADVNHWLKPESGVERFLSPLERPLAVSNLGSSAFTRQFAERIMMMTQGELKQATIRLDPPELGMMEIRISVQNDQTQVQILVQNPQVREALESQSVRLKEVLEQQGLSLENLDVNDQSKHRHSAEDALEYRRSLSDELADEAEGGLQPSSQPWQPRLGLIDDFV